MVDIQLFTTDIYILYISVIQYTKYKIISNGGSCMKRKILSWILSLAMILSAVPWSVAAEVEFEVEESAEKVEDVQAPVQKNGFFDNGSTTIELNDYVFYINGDD